MFLAIIYVLASGTQHKVMQSMTVSVLKCSASSSVCKNTSVYLNE